MTKDSASIIIPVYNEEKSIKNVVLTVLKSRLFGRVIIVNDGSTDKSPAILKSFGKKIDLINLPCNMGKGYALACGLQKARGKIVVFLDADFVNLEKKDLLKFISPLQEKKAQVVIAWPEEIKKNFSFLAGQRAYFRKDLTPHIKRMKICRFGIEFFLEDLAKKKKWKVKNLRLTNLKRLVKFDKTGYTQETLTAYLKEALEIAEEAARLYHKTAEEKIALQREILQKILQKYLKKSRKIIKKIISGNQSLKQIKKLLE